MPAATSAMFLKPQNNLFPTEEDHCPIHQSEYFSLTVVQENRLVVCPICSGCFILPRPYDENGVKNVNIVYQWINTLGACPNTFSSASKHKITEDELHTVRIKEWELITTAPEQLEDADAAKQLYAVGLKYISDRENKILNVAYLRGIMQKAAAYEPARAFAKLLPANVELDLPLPPGETANDLWEQIDSTAYSNNADFIYFVGTRSGSSFNSIARLFQAREMGCAEAAWNIWDKMKFKDGPNIDYLKKAAAQGHPYSCFPIAEKWYINLSEQSEDDDQWSLENDESRTMIQYFKIAAEAGVPNSYEKCAFESLMTDKPNGPDSDEIQCVPKSHEFMDCMMEGARRGDVDAQYILAMWLIDGPTPEYLEENVRLGSLETGIYWLQTAAERGYSEAQVKLAQCILMQEPIDWKKAIKWLSTSEASDTEHLKNLYHSCWAYVYVKYKKNIVKANEHWDQMPVKPFETMGDAQVDQELKLSYYMQCKSPNGMYKAGLMLEAKGLLEKAKTWWDKAAKAGSVEAKDKLLYVNGKLSFDREDMHNAVKNFLQMQNPPSEMLGDAYLFMSNDQQTKKRGRENANIENAKLWYERARAIDKLNTLLHNSQTIAEFRDNPNETLHRQVRRLLIN